MCRVQVAALLALLPEAAKDWGTPKYAAATFGKAVPPPGTAHGHASPSHALHMDHYASHMDRYASHMHHYASHVDPHEAHPPIV